MRTHNRIASVFAHSPTAGFLLLLVIMIAFSMNGYWTEPKAKTLIRLAKSKNWNHVESRLSEFDLSDWQANDLLQLANLTLQAAQWKVAERVIAAMPDTADQLETKLQLQCQLYQGRGDQLELLNAAQRLCQLNPKNHRHWQRLAGVHESQDNKLAAIMAYESALQQPIPQLDKNLMQHRSLSHCIDIGDARRARVIFHALIHDGERGPIMEVNHARILHLEGLPDQALLSLQAALKELGEIPDGLRLRGILYMELDREDEAIRDFLRVVNVAPQDELAYFKLAEAYRRLARSSGNESFMQLSRKYHERYQQIHNNQLRIKHD